VHNGGKIIGKLETVAGPERKRGESEKMKKNEGKKQIYGFDPIWL